MLCSFNVHIPQHLNTQELRHDDTFSDQAQGPEVGRWVGGGYISHSTLAFNAQTSNIHLLRHDTLSNIRVQSLEVGKCPCHMRITQMRGIRMGNATRGPCWSAHPVHSRQERVAQGALGGLASCQGADQIRIQGSARIYGRQLDAIYACPTLY